MSANDTITIIGGLREVQHVSIHIHAEQLASGEYEVQITAPSHDRPPTLVLQIDVAAGRLLNPESFVLVPAVA